MKTPYAGFEPSPYKHERTPFAAKLLQFNCLLIAVHVYL